MEIVKAMGRLGHVPYLLACAIATTGCALAPRFDASETALDIRSVGQERESVYNVALLDRDAAVSRFAAKHLAPGARLADGSTPILAAIEVFSESAGEFDIDPYLEYVMNMSFADAVRAALASVVIPLGRHTTATISIGLNAAGGLTSPLSSTSVPTGDPDASEWPKDESENVADVLSQLESVVVGVDVPIPGGLRARLAVDARFGWDAEIDPDAQETKLATWMLSVKYRAWFW